MPFAIAHAVFRAFNRVKRNACGGYGCRRRRGGSGLRDFVHLETKGKRCRDIVAAADRNGCRVIADCKSCFRNNSKIFAAADCKIFDACLRQREVTAVVAAKSDGQRSGSLIADIGYDNAMRRRFGIAINGFGKSMVARRRQRNAVTWRRIGCYRQSRACGTCLVRAGFFHPCIECVRRFGIETAECRGFLPYAIAVAVFRALNRVQRNACGGYGCRRRCGGSGLRSFRHDFRSVGNDAAQTVRRRYRDAYPLAYVVRRKRIGLRRRPVYIRTVALPLIR